MTDTKTESPATKKNNKNQILSVLLPIIVVIGIVAAFPLVFPPLPSELEKNPAHEGHSHSQPLKEGDALPDFQLHPFKGSPQKVSSLNASLLVVNFWASWCIPCLVEMPSLIALQKEFASQGVKVLLINVDENPEERIPMTMSRLKIDFPSYIDHEQKLSELLSIEGLPATAILDRNRKILLFHEGEKDWNSKKVQKLIREFLQKT